MFATLLWHRLVETPATPFEVTWDDFRRQLDALVAQGFVGDSVAGLDARLQSGDALPDKYVVLTFDDGFDSDLRAGEELAARGLTASFAIVSGWIGQEGRLDRDGLSVLAQTHDVGSHTATHSTLSAVNAKTLKREMVDSRAAIQAWTGTSCDTIALPGGAGGGRARRAARRAGYTWVATSRPAYNLAAVAARTRRLARCCLHAGESAELAVRFGTCDPRASARRLPRYLWIQGVRRVLPEPAFVAIRSVLGRG